MGKELSNFFLLCNKSPRFIPYFVTYSDYNKKIKIKSSKTRKSSRIVNFENFFFFYDNFLY